MRMTSRHVTLCVLLLVSQITASCVTDGESLLNNGEYPIVKCTNVTVANLGREARLVRSKFSLVLENINFQHLKSISNFPYDEVIHLVINENALNIREDAFSKFPWLDSLEIHGGNLPHFIGFRDPAPLYYYVFTNLNMTNNNMSTIESVCQHSKDLKKLQITENNILEIKNRTFSSCSQLTHLNLFANNIQNLEPGSFNGLNELTWLDLKSNKILNIRSNTFLALSRLTDLDLSNCTITSMDLMAFNGLFCLQNLDLRYNDITELLPETFKQTSELRRMNLSYNKLHWMGQDLSMGAFHGLDKLNWLILKSNKILNISSNTFLRLSTLTNLDLSNLSITSIDAGSFNGLYNMQKLDLSLNNITELATEMFNQTSKLTSLDLTHNKIQRIAAGALDGLNSLVYLNMSYDEVEHIHCDTSYKSLENMRSWDLSHNRLSVVDACTFRHVERLTSLNLSHNDVSHVLRGTFSPLGELQQLSLSHNRLKALDAALMFPLVRLQSLDVSGNILDNWDVQSVVSHMKLLSHVDLSANSWNCDYLRQMLNYLVGKDVDTRPRQPRIYLVENVHGIQCAGSDQNVTQKENTTNAHSNLNINTTDEESKSSVVNMLKLLVEMKRNDELKMNGTLDYLKEISERLLNNGEHKENKLKEQLNGIDINSNVTIETFKEIGKKWKENLDKILNEIIEIKYNGESRSNQTLREQDGPKNKQIDILQTMLKILGDQKIKKHHEQFNDKSYDLADLVRVLYVTIVLILTCAFVFCGYVVTKRYHKIRHECAMRRRSNNTTELETLNVRHS